MGSVVLSALSDPEGRGITEALRGMRALKLRAQWLLSALSDPEGERNH